MEEVFPEAVEAAAGNGIMPVNRRIRMIPSVDITFKQAFSTAFTASSSVMEVS
ncbi:hypothetical protein [Clostridium sp. HBUAS56010]|uniref:hypothetical protein n=1 Tax=Clostridium sp. HBUAS56010 TaxID=2571127 RepID=UPI00163D4BFA|nr:hypothetical protein [Clostridium sp. HBUAS56010]